MESFLLSWCERTQLLTAAVMVRWCWQRWCFRFRYSCISRLKIDLKIDRKPPQKWADLEGVLILFSKSILRWDGQDQNRLQNRLKYLLTERALGRSLRFAQTQTQKGLFWFAFAFAPLWPLRFSQTQTQKIQTNSNKFKKCRTPACSSSNAFDESVWLYHSCH